MGETIRNKSNQLLTSTTLHSVLFMMLSLFSIQTGVLQFSWQEVFFGQGNSQFTLLVSRLPRLMAVVLSGASLSISGLIMQTIHANRFVSPSTTGTMDWARLGILVSMIVFRNQAPLLQMTIAFGFALLGSLLFVLFIQQLKVKNKLLVPLIGMIMGSVISSFTTFVAYQMNLVQSMTTYLQGSFSLIVKGEYELLLVGIPFLLIAMIFASRFTIVGMGKTITTNLGLNYNTMVTIALIIVSVMTSSVVVTIGTIPFVGLIIPNMVTMIKGDHLKNSIGMTALLGANFLLLCDLISRRLIFPYEISISVIISILGAILFMNMIKKGDSK